MSEIKVEAVLDPQRSGADERKSRSLERVRQYALIVALIILIVLFALISDHFFTANNFLNIARQVSITAIVAVGMTFVIITGGIDLSVGSVLALTGIAAAFTLDATGNVMLAVLAGIAVGGLVGLINGFLTSVGKISGFIATLAMMGIARGVAFIVTGGNPVTASEPGFKFLGSGSVFGIAVPVLIMICVAVLGWFLLNKTKFGRYVYAIGGNMTAAQWTGVNVKLIQGAVYTIIGFLAGLAGVLLAARLGSGQPGAGNGFELDVIAAVILGGSSLAGGKGRISGTLIGVLIIGVLNNGLTLMNVSTYWQMAVQGVIILLAVLMDQAVGRKEA